MILSSVVVLAASCAARWAARRRSTFSFGVSPGGPGGSEIPGPRRCDGNESLYAVPEAVEALCAENLEGAWGAVAVKRVASLTVPDMALIAERDMAHSVGTVDLG